MTLDPPKIIIIAGATASGKSSLAIKIAKALSGEIVNFDCVQVFKEFDIGSGKVGASEMDGIAHHLVDSLVPNEECNVAQYVRLADQAIDGIVRRKKIPIIVGGTGMYVKALLHGLAKLPAADEKLRASLANLSNSELYSKVKQIDPVSAERIHPNDRTRLIRVIEIFELAGLPASKIQAAHGFGEVRYQAIIVHLCWPREELYKRINQRVSKMICAGLVGETKRLIDNYGPSCQGLKSLGYMQVREYLEGRISQAELEPKIAQETRRFAKRQLTFWVNQPEKLGWIVMPQNRSDSAKVVVVDESSKPTNRKGNLQKSFLACEWDLSLLIDEISNLSARAEDRIYLCNVTSERLVD